METKQREYIEANLLVLNKIILVNDSLLAYFKSQNVLHDEEIQEINQPAKTGIAKSHSLLEFLFTRQNGFEILKAALKLTNQTGALKILEAHRTDKRCCGKIIYYTKTPLGSARSGTKVYLGQFDGSDVAVKRITCENDDGISVAMEEVEHLRKLRNHPHIVQYYYSESDDYDVFIAMELCKFTLATEITERKNTLPAKEIIHQMTKGVAYLHGERIVHRDIKPTNILISIHNLIKIVDFGISKQIPTGECGIGVTSAKGTEEWMAPEVQEDYDKTNTRQQTMQLLQSSDVFSLGCVVFYVLSAGKHPFGDGTRVQKMYNIQEGKPQIDGVLEANWLELVTDMISHEPTMRPAAENVCKLIEPLLQRNVCDDIDRTNQSKKSEVVANRIDSTNAGYLPGPITVINTCCAHQDKRPRFETPLISCVTTVDTESKNLLHRQISGQGKTEFDGVAQGFKANTELSSGTVSNFEMTPLCQKPEKQFEENFILTKENVKKMFNYRNLNTLKLMRIMDVELLNEDSRTEDNSVAHETAIEMDNSTFVKFVCWVEQTGLTHLLLKTNSKGFTPLHLRLMSKNCNTDKTLVENYLKCCKDVHNNTDNDGNNLLMAAMIGEQDITVLQALVDFEVSLTHCNNMGQSLLHIAVQSLRTSYVKFCLKHNMSVRQKDNQGNSPMDLIQVLLQLTKPTSKGKVKSLNKIEGYLQEEEKS